MNNFNPGHYLLGCRLDNWLRLLWQNRFHIDGKKIPQTLLITAVSLLLAPFALLEHILFAPGIRRTRLKNDPIFILGFWRSGTTYLQNMLSRDRQFAWADPASINLFPVSQLLGGLLSPILSRSLRDARPMDNLEYRLDLPMEETFAMMTVNEQNLLHLLAFPENYRRYVGCTFLADLPEKDRQRWLRQYDFLLKKLTLGKSGKQLILKSPDNTARIRELLELYPDARFINIHRDPYATLRSAIHMLTKQLELMELTERPEDFQELMEDIFLDIFERMYREMFELQKEIPASRWVDLPYADFVAAPVERLREIYAQLEIRDFAAARPYFEAHAQSQRNYVKNKLDMSARFKEKINKKLGFYFEHYGYSMEET